MDCVFCKIIKGEIPSKKFFENEDFIIIEDLNKIAPKHYLLIPKEHYAFLSEANEHQSIKFSKMLKKLDSLKNELGLDEGFRLIINQGEKAGQSVFHLHCHIVGGKELNWEKL